MALDANEVHAKVRDITCDQLGVEPEQVTLDAKFVDDLGADSLDIVQLVIELEETFGKPIPDEDVGSIRSVGDAVSYILERAA